MNRTRSYEPKVVIEVRKLEGLRKEIAPIQRKPMGRALFSAVSQAVSQNDIAQRKQA